MKGMGIYRGMDIYLNEFGMLDAKGQQTGDSLIQGQETESWSGGL